MDKYHVMLKPKALEEIDLIYEYIALELHNQEAALGLVDEFEKAILSLETLPYRGTERKIGMFANRGYRQIFLKNFTIIYRVEAYEKKVIISHVVYSKSDF